MFSGGFIRAGANAAQLFVKIETLCYGFLLPDSKPQPAEGRGRRKGTFEAALHNLRREWREKRIFLFGFTVSD
jgi:hypothetical protein